MARRTLAGLAALVAISVLPPPDSGRVAAATTYFIDWDRGSDTADGRTPDTAWKRAPGDSRAGPVPRSVVLAPGDTLQFRGGVRYRGTIVIRTGGADARPIRYLGEGWGDGAAILDGGLPLQGRPCRSRGDCLGLADWAGLVRLKLPREVPAGAPLFQAGAPIATLAARAGGEGGVAVVRGDPARPAQFAAGMGRPGLLLVAGGHLEVRGFRFAHYADLPARGPFAGAPLAQLQPMPAVSFLNLEYDLDLAESGARPTVRRAVDIGPVIAGFRRGPT